MAQRKISGLPAATTPLGGDELFEVVQSGASRSAALASIWQVRDTSDNFTADNPVLGVGQTGYETDTGLFKFGDGINQWTDLEYAAARASGGGGGVEVGTIFPVAGTTPPVGSILCDGSAVSRSVYAELFAVIGTTWGAGDGSTTFNVPDLRGAFLRGTGSHGSETMADGNPFAGPAVGSFEDDQFQGHRIVSDSSSGTTGQPEWPLAAYAGRGSSVASGGAETGSQRAAFNDVGGSAPGSVAAAVIGSDDTNGTPRTGDETRPFAAGVTYCIKASRVTATGDTVTALRYDTGWQAMPSAGSTATVQHNLGAELTGLIVQGLVRDGSGNTSGFVDYFSGTDWFGETFEPNDANSFFVQVMQGGARGTRTGGSGGFIATEYRVHAYKPEIISRVSAGNVRSVSGDYTITGPLDAPSILVTTGATDRTVTLPSGSAMTPGDAFDVTKVDSGSGDVILAAAGSDTINGAASTTRASQYGHVRVMWTGNNLWVKVAEL